MNNAHQNAALTIRAQVLTTEHATNSAAEEQALLVAAMLRSRRELECPVSLGNAAVDRAHQALTRSLGSLRSLAMMHQSLHGVATEVHLDMEDYGTSETVPNKPGGHLRVA